MAYSIICQQLHKKYSSASCVTVTESCIDFVFLLIRVHLWLMSVVTQFVVWLIYFAAQSSVYMSGCYWFSLPTFTLRNIIKSEFCFLQNIADSRGEADTSHLLCCAFTLKKKRLDFVGFFCLVFYTLFHWQSLALRAKWEVFPKSKSE